MGEIESGALPAPARVQLIALASDVLATLAHDEIPAGLRTIARFTPAKRARLGSAALSATLDGDEEFRAAVSRAIETATPDLVTQVARAAADGSSEPVAAADPVDVAVVAYLTRPNGWAATVAAAGERWTAAQADDGSRAELERLRAEVAGLRSRSRGEDARVKAAAAEAVAGVEAELGQLRRTVRTRTGELRAAERDAEAARDRLAEVQRELAQARSELEAERARVRVLHQDVERAGEAVRRDARVERDLDDARLWLLTDTLVQAAAGIRRELSLAPPSVRPADAVEVASAGADAVARRSVPDDDVVALDRLLGLPNVHLIVDGYNVTKTGYPDLPLADQRARLVGSLAALAARAGAEITVAFDGAARPPVQPAAPRGVRVLFSAADEIADDLIRRLVAAEPRGRRVVVVSSDRAVAADVARDGADPVASVALLARLR